MTNILVVPKADYLIFEIDCEVGDSLSYVDRLPVKIADFYSLLNNKGLFKNRAEAEEDENYLQIIPYIVCTQDDKYFLYKRLKKGTESRLHDKLSAGIGGHVDFQTESMNNREHFLYNANKELHEELSITDKLDKSKIPGILKNFTGYLIYDMSNAVGRVHLGALMTCNLSNYDVAVRETHKIEGEFYTKQQLQDIYKDRGSDAFETWTTIALSKLGVISE